jgi:hypothetical protein
MVHEGRELVILVLLPDGHALSAVALTFPDAAILVKV